uniref:DUF7054 domain-containing protein n=1 Tax=Medicago truncatula TaxID=3880 RepID=I3T9L4_MEDTR|nr:unknown [Medicago truncatula]
MLIKQKKNQNAKDARKLLININVLGSAGPIRFVVSEGDLVATVIDTALKSYAREGRLPILGKDVTSFALYCQHVGSDALSPLDTIGSHGGARNFMLCKKPETTNRWPMPMELSHWLAAEWEFEELVQQSLSSVYVLIS